MRFSDLMLVCIATLVLAFPANANCFVCDEVVEFDAIRAACFMTDFEQFSSEANTNGRAEVDLSSCAGGDAAGSRGLDAFPFFPDGKTRTPNIELRSVYILDGESLKCLHTILKNRTDPIDPSMRIDLVTTCQ
jgi:hypothetical protein